jgi:hypothetical protein
MWGNLTTKSILCEIWQESLCLFCSPQLAHGGSIHSSAVSVHWCHTLCQCGAHVTCPILCGVVWCGVVWCGVVWCGVENCVHRLSTSTCQTSHRRRSETLGGRLSEGMWTGRVCLRTFLGQELEVTYHLCRADSVLQQQWHPHL